MRIPVIVHPNAKGPKVEKDMLGQFHVYVSQPPLEGKANLAATEALAKLFNIKKNRVILISGGKSKSKLFEIIINS